MGYLDSYNLSRDSKAIIASTSAGKYNYKDLLSSKFSSFYKAEILNYIANHFDQTKDNVETFKKVLDMISLDISDVPNAEIFFLQMLANQENFRKDALLFLKDIFSSNANDVEQIPKINNIARQGALSKYEYSSLIYPIIDKNFDKESLFKEIVGEIGKNGFSEDNSGYNVTGELISQYLKHYKVENGRSNEILDIISETRKKDKQTEIEAIEDEVVKNLLFMSSADNPRIDEKDVRILAISSLTEKDLKRFNWVAAIGAFDVLVHIQKENPGLREVTIGGIKNLLNHPEVEYCLESFIKSGLKEPSVAEEITKKIKKINKPLKPQKFLWLPIMAELNGGIVANESLDITAAAIRQSNSYHQIKAVFDKVNENIDDKKGKYHHLDFNSKSYKYLAFVALNDSKINAVGAYALAKELWAKSIEEGIVKKENTNSLKEIIKIIGSSHLIKNNREIFSRMMAKMKSKEFSQNYPDDVKTLLNKMVSRAMPEAKTDIFVDRLVNGAIKHDKCYDEYFKEEKPETVYEKTLETVENIVKSNKLELNERKNIASSIGKLYEIEGKVDHKRCGNLIRSLNFGEFPIETYRGFDEGRK